MRTHHLKTIEQNIFLVKIKKNVGAQHKIDAFREGGRGGGVPYVSSKSFNSFNLT